MKCWKCDKDKDFDSKKSLRMHQISSGEYDKDEFNEKFDEKSDSIDEMDESESEDNGSGDGGDDLQAVAEEDSEDDGQDKEESSVKLEDVSGSSESTDLDKLVEGSSDEDDSDEVDVDGSSSSERKGLDTAINNAWGRIATIDLPPEEDETSNMRKNIQGLAEDVGLGHNAKWYYEEELKGDTDDPKKAVMGSLLLATVMTLSVRPELAQKIRKQMKNKSSSTSKADKSEDTTEDE
jgi:hypothetical protein